MKMAVEQVSKYHPDKYADAIATRIVDSIVNIDPDAHCGIEVMVKDTTVVLGGEIKTKLNKRDLKVCIDSSIKIVSRELGYEVTKVINLLGRQSPEIDKAVMSDDNFGAGDQGIVTGYANILDLVPNVLDNMNKHFAKMVADNIIKRVENIADWGEYGMLKGDAKTLVVYDTDKNAISKIVLSMCHNENIPIDAVKALGASIIMSSLDYMSDEQKITKIITPDFEINVNPAGPWTIGGPIADSGITNRKLVCDAYGPQVPIGGGGYWGKDYTKIDNSGAKALRIIARELLTEDVQTVKEVFIELGYVIGQPQPCSINVITGNKAHDKKLYDILINNYDLTPRGLMKIIKGDEDNG